MVCLNAENPVPPTRAEGSEKRFGAVRLRLRSDLIIGQISITEISWDRALNAVTPQSTDQNSIET
jgi:hypothetical protein